MADNMKVLPSTSGSAVDVATDEVGGVHHPIQKMAFGDNGTVILAGYANPIPVKDFLIAVSEGLIPGYSLVHKYGRNAAVANGVDTTISQVATGIVWRQSASTFRIAAGGDAGDAAAGLGSQSVIIQGITDALIEDTDTLVTAGASASSASTKLFWRVHRAWSGPVGTYGGSNLADIVIEDSASAANHLMIAAGEGQSQYLAFTIPTGKVGYFMSMHAHVETTKTADIKVWTRQNFNDVTTPFSPTRLKLNFAGRSDAVKYEPKTPEFSMPALTDVWVTGNGNGASAELPGNFEILLVDV